MGGRRLLPDTIYRILLHLQNGVSEEETRLQIMSARVIPNAVANVGEVSQGLLSMQAPARVCLAVFGTAGSPPRLLSFDAGGRISDPR